MGSQNVSLPHPHTLQQIEQLCGLTARPYHMPSDLTFDPRQPGEEFLMTYLNQEPSYSLHDTRVSLEGLESEHLLSPTSQNASSLDASFEDSKHGVLQKNQVQKRVTHKTKKIKKVSQRRERREKVAQMVEQSHSEEPAGDCIRDQNNCKSYHKIVKNYLISKGKGDLMEPYDNQYHTRYYFICALIFIRHYLDSNFTDTYRELVYVELESQQRKAERKQQQVARLDERLKSAGEAQRVPMSERRSRLLKQMEHIKVVKHEIEDYSMRSCAAFFQGELEESLKILYLKNDPVMRKKYYFLDALQRVTDLQSQVRKHPSHN